jgi:type VI secretion system secreted protein VgrG
MANKPLVYLLEIGGQLLPVREVRGREALSTPCRFEVQLFLPEGAELDPDAVIKSEAKLILTRGATARTITAVVSEAYVLASVAGQPELTVVLEPRFALCRFRTNIKIFRNKTAPQIVAEVLGETGVQLDQRLSASYPVRRYCVQYRETDLHFVSRLLEEEGIFYFFGPGDVMVQGDSPSAYDSLGGVPFFDASGMDRNDEAVEAIGARGAAGPSQVTLRDWNPEKPSLNMDVSAAGPTAAGPEYYDFPGEYEDPGAGQRIANLMAEAFKCAATGVAGRGYVGAFAPGLTFELGNGPAGLGESSFVLTEVEHDWNREREGFGLEFRGLPAQTTFRPLRLHPEPDLPNPHTGIVTGPPGADIHTEEYGRVKVHFHWDRLQPFDGECSDWIPVLQDNTGHSVAHPRIGWEVLVNFLEGDPDRPVVLGRVYNAEDQFPCQLPRDKTYTMLRSLSSPTRDGINTIRFEDLQGKEHIYVHAEKDQHVIVAHDWDEKVLSNETVRIEHDETIDIGNDHTVKVGGDVTPTVCNDYTLTVGGDRWRTVGGPDQRRVVGNNTLTIGGMFMRRIEINDGVNTKQLQERVGGADLEVSIKTNGTTAGVAYALTVGGVIVEIAKGDKSESAARGRAETIGGVLFSKAGEEAKTEVATNRITTVGGALRVKSKGLLTLTGKEKLTAKSALSEHTAGQSLTVKVGESIITLKDGLIKIIAPQTIAMKISAENQQKSDKSIQNP